jgi:hypothetical protein
VTRTHDSLNELFTSARQATAPPLDVAERVRASVMRGRLVRLSDTPLWIAASLSLAAAAAVLLIVFVQSATTHDPFVQWLTSYAVGLS